VFTRPCKISVGGASSHRSDWARWQWRCDLGRPRNDRAPVRFSWAPLAATAAGIASQPRPRGQYQVRWPAQTSPLWDR